MLPFHDWLLLASICALGAMAPGIPTIPSNTHASQRCHQSIATHHVPPLPVCHHNRQQ